MINFANATLNRIISHRIFSKQKGDESAQVKLVNELVFADTNVQRTIKQRSTDALGRQSRSFVVDFEKFGKGSFFSFAHDIFDVDDNEFIKRSQSITTLLAHSQKRTNSPGGYLIILDGKTDDYRPFLLVIKAELQEAITAGKNEKTHQPQMEYLEEIFLSPAEKFFKMGLLYKTQTPGKEFPGKEFGSMN